MGLVGGHKGLCRVARLLSVAAGAVALANCSGGIGKIDPRYGVSASARVIAPGEPVPKGGGVYHVGKPYVVGGRLYVPKVDPDYSQVGLASWYGDDFHGRYTANGEIFDKNAITAAHPTLPLPSYARVTNLKNHRSIVVRINDRGPYVGNRIIDLSTRTAKLLGFYGHGLAKVKVEYVGRAPLAGSDDRKLLATLREGVPTGAKAVRVASNWPFARTYFDSHRMTELPPPRPYGLGEGAGAASTDIPTTELAANARPHPEKRLVQTATAAPPPEPRVTSPVSAYASMRNDGHAGFMSGRGLY
jgi:rare lipoprotein A